MRLLCSKMLLAGLMFGSPAQAALESPRNYIAAIVNETIITRGQIEEAAGGVIEPLLRTVSRPEMLAQKEIDALEHKIQGLLGETLEQMIENRLILDDFKTSGARVPDAIVDDEIKDRIRQHWHDRATLIKELNSLGRTYDTFRQQVREEMILHYMRDKNVSSAILISPQKIERYYSTNLAQFQLGNQVRLRMIVLNCSGGSAVAEVRKMAQEISLKLDEGAAFSEMATIYSEGSQRKEGGDFGWREDSKILKGLADIAKTLKPGQHSGILGFARDLNDAYWIYQYDKTGQLTVGRKYTDKPDSDKNELLEERKFSSPFDEANLPAAPIEFRLMMVEDRRVARTESLAEVREKIEKDLLVREKERLRKKWVDRLRAKAFVRFF